MLATLDRDGEHVATIEGRQWDALSRIMRAAQSDAEYELLSAIEADGARGAETLLAAAAALARELVERSPHTFATGRRDLRKWIRYLAPAAHLLDVDAPPVVAARPPIPRPVDDLDVGAIEPARIYRLAAPRIFRRRDLAASPR